MINKQIFGIPVVIIVLGIIIALVASIPSFIVYSSLAVKLDRIDTALYVLESTNQVVLAPSEASKSATISGKAK